MDTYVNTRYSPIFPVTIGAVPAVMVTILLILLMHSLIATDMPDIPEDPKRAIQLVRPPEKVMEPTRVKPPAAPVEVMVQPKLFDPNLSLEPSDDDLAWVPDTPVVTPQGETEIGVGGGGIVAYLKPQPIYPSRPLSRGIEGYVDLAFDITSAGSTTNIRIIDAVPSGAFEQAAVRALKKWKYKVPVVDGVPEGQADMMTRMSFSLEQ